MGRDLSLYLSGAKELVTAAADVTDGSQTWTNGPAGAPTSYSETSSQGGSSTDPLPPSDAPGTFASWTSAPVGAATDIVGSPTLEVTLDSKAAATTQSGGPAGQLVVFAQRVRIELPGVVQRFEKGHRIRLVLAASDAAYARNAAVLPVTVAADTTNPAVLTLPVVSGPGPKGSAGGTPTKKPKPGAGATDDDEVLSDGSGPGARPGGTASQRGTGGGGVASESGAVLSAGALASTGADGGTAATVALTGLLLLLAGGLLVRGARSL